MLSEALWCDKMVRSPHGALYSDSIFYAIVARLMTLSEYKIEPAPRRAKLSHAIVAKVEAYMRDRIEVGVTVQELADFVGYSPFHFRRLLKAATGMNPHERLIFFRVERAKELLATHPEWTVAAIAQQCGFSDQGHMSRHFRKLHGRSPSWFREEN